VYYTKGWGKCQEVFAVFPPLFIHQLYHWAGVQAAVQTGGTGKRALGGNVFMHTLYHTIGECQGLALKNFWS